MLYCVFKCAHELIKDTEILYLAKLIKTIIIWWLWVSLRVCQCVCVCVCQCVCVYVYICINDWSKQKLLFVKLSVGRACVYWYGQSSVFFSSNAGYIYFVFLSVL